ncbi:hypothetical protein KJ918_00195, partial [Patescibacteria group bacterium]|nr:hypothetical protein [Patescibacteria group bacterium]
MKNFFRKKLFTKRTLVSLTILAFMFFGLRFSSPIRAASVTWIGGNGDWETGSNWSGGIVPGPDDDVVIDLSVTVQINGTTTINSLTLGKSDNSVNATLNFNYDAVSSGALIIDEGSVTIYANTITSTPSITHTAGTTAVVGTVCIDVQSGSFTLNSSTLISVSGKGYRYSEGDGQGTDVVTNSTGGGGGGYGGEGGDGAGSVAGGGAYGDVDMPLDLGSGGGNASGYYGGNGGGSVYLVVEGELALDGSIESDGLNGAGSQYSYRNAGGGSGGSVYIDAGVISGGGTIYARGGNGYDGSYSDGGSGSGGRIAIYFDMYTFLGSALANTGTATHNNYRGAAGTIYLKDNVETYGDLVIDNNNLASTSKSTLQVETDFTCKTIMLRNRGRYGIPNGSNFTVNTSID